MGRVNHIAEWLAAATLLAAGALPLPCLAQRNAFQSSTQPQRIQQPPKQQQGAHSQPHPSQRPQQGHAGDWLRRYKDVPPHEQQRALQNDPQFRRLPPDRQQQLQQRLSHFSSLPPQQQQRMLNRMETWEHLTPEQKQQARQIFGQMQALSPDRRRQVTTAIRDLRAMPPQQRERIINSDRFKTMFSPEERDMMRGATRLPLAPPEGGDRGGPQEH